jgi:replication factor C subunit 2/4
MHHVGTSSTSLAEFDIAEVVDLSQPLCDSAKQTLQTLQVKSILKSNQPWTEKYRPKTLDDLACQTPAVESLKSAALSAQLPHLLLYGPPGTGKTSAARAVVKQLFGSDVSKRVLELNASDARSVDTVRSTIKDFARRTAPSKSNSRSSASLSQQADFNVIILDEADSMTLQAQNALRRTIELYSKTTRFFLICNYVSNILPAIASRCCKLLFATITAQDVQNRLDLICSAENVQIDSVSVLANACQGDLRRAISSLQLAAVMSQTTTLEAEHVAELAGVIPSKAVQPFLEAVAFKNIALLTQAVDDILSEGFMATAFIKQVLHSMMDHLVLKNKDQVLATLAVSCAKADAILRQGGNVRIQLLYIGMQAICAV